MNISREEYLEWKKHPVTAEFREYVRQAIKDSTDVLVAGAGEDSKLDRFLVGGISAFNDCLDWQPIEEEDEHSES